ncbi:hypothetical protein COCNU_06G017570 [Cocos nucifera]|uniref:Uncharacterized protein n=1 Tax=Cocos nucifera TaxID=13894 RepID=A0A8K0ICQ5_COCNU|nr:hypothetical protein COCNU_06G017570 [Cocos nucifera]
MAKMNKTLVFRSTMRSPSSFLSLLLLLSLEIASPLLLRFRSTARHRIPELLLPRRRRREPADRRSMFRWPPTADRQAVEAAPGLVQLHGDGSPPREVIRAGIERGADTFLDVKSSSRDSYSSSFQFTRS